MSGFFMFIGGLFVIAAGAVAFSVSLTDIVIGIVVSGVGIGLLLIAAGVIIARLATLERQILQLVPETEGKPKACKTKDIEASVKLKEQKVPANHKINFWDYAYVKRFDDYNLYYLFEETNKIVAYFSTSDTCIEYGEYTGKLSAGATIEWERDWMETLQIKAESNVAILVDGNGYSWEYEKCTVSEAQKVFEGLI